MPTRDEAVNLVHAMINDGMLGPQDLARFVPKACANNAETIREEWEHWYRGLGIETIIGRPFSLAPCPFPSEDVAAMQASDNIVLCVPRGLTRAQLGELFRLSSWALTDAMVGDTPESEDFWFTTSRSPSPPYLNKTATEVRRTFEDENKLGFSLERYLVFAARYRFLTGKYPDFRYWTWLMRGRYDRSGMLIAGFDPLGRFSVHAWMPNFQASFLGARYLEPPATVAAHGELQAGRSVSVAREKEVLAGESSRAQR